MKLLNFDYALPDELIARYPAENRSDSRLLGLDKTSGAITDTRFTAIGDLIGRGDCLVLNETKVIPARLQGTRDATGAVVEIFLLHKRSDRTDTWHVLAAPAKKVREGERISINERLSCFVTNELENGERIVRFEAQGIDLESAIEQAGTMPIPPYLHRDSEPLDRERYQTVFAKVPGAVAAPTASLHFTDDILQELTQKGANIAKVILHVGLGTFKPVEVEDIREHTMHSEYFEVTDEASKIINNTRKSGGRIIAVGTTAARVLESASDDAGVIHPQKGDTSIYIYPPYRFKAVDAMVTNFHQPRSTLLMMISAFAGYENVMKAYNHAISERYRFLSYGDAMWIG